MPTPEQRPARFLSRGWLSEEQGAQGGPAVPCSSPWQDAHSRDLQSACECWKNRTQESPKQGAKEPGAPVPKKEVATKKAEYGGDAAVGASRGQQGYWQEPGLTTKAGGACAGILLLGADS